MEDVNNDGVIEIVDMIPCGVNDGHLDKLYILPITPEKLSLKS